MSDEKAAKPKPTVRVIYRAGKLTVLDEATGKPIPGVRQATLHLTPDGFSEAVLYISNPSVSVVVERSADGVRAG